MLEEIVKHCINPDFNALILTPRSGMATHYLRKENEVAYAPSLGRMIFPSGATLTIGRPTEDSWVKYAGACFNLIWLENCPKNTQEELMSRLRFITNSTCHILEMWVDGTQTYSNKEKSCLNQT